MSVPPSERWTLLLEGADWSDFFATATKTHRELRWWYCLAAANRRVFLCHTLAFGILAIAAYPMDNESDVSAAFNGWGSWRMVPFLTLVAPASGVGGRAFASWAAPENEKAKHDFFSSVCSALLTVGAAVGLYIGCGRVSPSQLKDRELMWYEWPLL